MPRSPCLIRVCMIRCSGLFIVQHSSHNDYLWVCDKHYNLKMKRRILKLFLQNECCFLLSCGTVAYMVLVPQASVNMKSFRIQPGSNASCNGSYQTHNSFCLPKGEYLCISVLKYVIHMLCIGSNWSLSLLLLIYVSGSSVFPTGCQFTSATLGARGGLMVTFYWRFTLPAH